MKDALETKTQYRRLPSCSKCRYMFWLALVCIHLGANSHNLRTIEYWICFCFWSSQIGMASSPSLSLTWPSWMAGPSEVKPRELHPSPFPSSIFQCRVVNPEMRICSSPTPCRWRSAAGRWQCKTCSEYQVIGSVAH